MNILGRFKDIMAANINSLFDKMEDPEKMIDQYLRNMEKDLAVIASETAAVMATESAAKRRVDECEEEIEKMERYAKKALQAREEDDARMFLRKKETLKTKLATLDKEKEVAVENSRKMREMHDKLVADIKKLSDKKAEIKSKMKMAETAKKINSMTSASGSRGNIDAFGRMEEKANRMLDEANAQIELNSPKTDEVDDLMRKYDDNEVKNYDRDDDEIDDEIRKMKRELGID